MIKDAPAVPIILSPEIDSSSKESNEVLDNLTETLTVWKSLKNSPNELWIILICKFFESFSFLSEDFTFMLFFHDEFGLNDVECGTLYSFTAVLAFLYGLFISGFFIDYAGVKASLLMGSFLLSTARLLICFITTKQ